MHVLLILGVVILVDMLLSNEVQLNPKVFDEPKWDFAILWQFC